MSLVDRVKWFRDRADRDRFREEMEILEAEFERTIISFRRMASSWLKLADQQLDCQHPGAAAYAHRKVAMYNALAHDCEVTYISARTVAGRQSLPACGGVGLSGMGWDRMG